jgi:chromosome segregation ATPase
VRRYNCQVGQQFEHHVHYDDYDALARATAQVAKQHAGDAAQIEQLRGELSLAEEGLANYAQENERLKHRCNALAYLHYGHYLVQRDRQSLQADIEACESALTALRAELAALPQEAEYGPKG